MAKAWITRSDAIEPTIDHYLAEWNAPVLAGWQLQRSLIWTHWWARVDGLAAPFGRVLPGLIGLYQSRIDTSDVGTINVHDADLDWISWQVVNFDWRVSETEGGTFSTFYNGWGYWDVRSQRTALTDNPYGAIAIHTVVGGGGGSDLSMGTYSCTWTVRQLWTSPGSDSMVEVLSHKRFPFGVPHTVSPVGRV
jgi:hypothetical protein